MILGFDFINQNLSSIPYLFNYSPSSFIYQDYISFTVRRNILFTYYKTQINGTSWNNKVYFSSTLPSSFRQRYYIHVNIDILQIIFFIITRVSINFVFEFKWWIKQIKYIDINIIKLLLFHEFYISLLTWCRILYVSEVHLYL